MEFFVRSPGQKKSRVLAVALCLLLKYLECINAKNTVINPDRIIFSHWQQTESLEFNAENPTSKVGEHIIPNSVAKTNDECYNKGVIGLESADCSPAH